MKYLTPYKVATYLLLLYFIGHTFGGMLAQPSMGPASDAVFEAMKTVHFDFNGSDSTWYGFWFGFGLMTSAYLSMSAFIAGWLDRIPMQNFRLVAPIAWALTFTQAANAILSILYFFAGPAAFGIAITALLAIGTVRKTQRAARAS